VDEKRRIIGAEAPHPLLYNVSPAAIERFRQQVSLIDLQFEGDAEVLRKAVWCCYQENPTPFRQYTLYDPGAYPQPPLGERITWRVTQPWSVPADEEEKRAVDRVRAMIERIRERGRNKPA